MKFIKLVVFIIVIIILCIVYNISHEGFKGQLDINIVNSLINNSDYLPSSLYVLVYPHVVTNLHDIRLEAILSLSRVPVIS
jgi:hypothetical protein